MSRLTTHVPQVDRWQPSKYERLPTSRRYSGRKIMVKSADVPPIKELSFIRKYK